MIKKHNKTVHPYSRLNTWKIAIILLCSGVFLANPANVLTFSIPPFEEAFRLGFTAIITMFAGILLGPMMGAILGGLNDILSVAIWHGMDEYLFSFTLTSIARGFLAGYIYNHIFASFSLKAIIAAISIPYIVVSGISTPILLYRAYGVPLLENIFLRLTLQAIAVPIYIFVTYFIMRGIKDSRELKELHKRMEKLLRTDDLTGLSNRRSFMEYLGKMVSRAQRHSQPLSVIVADVDNFKNINDTYGHNVGDDVLVALGKIFQDETRQEDMAARIGGEEFAIILAEADEKAAVQVAERIREKISQIYFPPIEDKITASFGITRIKDDDDLKKFLIRGDKALYEGKKAGKDRVVAG